MQSDRPAAVWTADAPRSWRWFGAACAVAALIGLIDYATGVELRVYPLYYLPISVAAWHTKRLGAVIVAVLCIGLWFLSNTTAGMHYSRDLIWALNLLAQGASFVFVGLLIAMLRSAIERERSFGRTDPLTGLLNARGFYEEGARSIALCRRSGKDMALAYLDLDDFKTVNDTLGHYEGDLVLGRMADALRRAVRQSDLIARVGGDEFAVLLLGAGLESASATIDRLRQVLAADHAGVPGVRVSIGVVLSAGASAPIDDMLRVADRLMYRSKAAGKDRVSVEVLPARADVETV